MSSMTRKNSENSQQAAQFMNAVNLRVVEANKTLADLEKPGARNLIRAELINGFNNVLGDSSVQEIYITEFGIQ